MGAKQLFSLLTLLVICQPWVSGARLAQIVPFLVIGGPEEGIHFRTILILSSLEGVGGTLALTDDSGQPVAGIFSGIGPTVSFDIQNPEIVITSQSREIQGLKASVDVGPNTVVFVKIQMFDGQRFLTQIDQRAVIPEFQRNPQVVSDVAPPLRGAVVQLDTRRSRNLGLVVLNPSSGNARVHFTAKTSVGPALNLQSEQFTVGPGQRLVGLPDAFFKDTKDLLRDRLGTIEIRSDRPILVVAVQIDWPELRSLPIFPLLLANEIFVSPGGDDINGDGGREKPFRTLGKALRLAETLTGDNGWLFTGSRLTIRADGGFTAAGGNSFPLIIEQPEALTTEIVGATLEGGGNFEGTNATLVLKNGNLSLKACSVTNPNQGGVGVMVKGGSLSVGESQFSGNTIGILFSRETRPGSNFGLVSSTFSKNDIAIQFRGQASSFVARTNFFGNGTAIEIKDQSGSEPQHRFEDNTIISNKIGIVIFDRANVDLGGGVRLSKGRNTLRGNTEVDLCHQGSTTISARQNIWDSSVPSRSSSCSGGVDIGGSAAEKVLVN